MADLADMIQKAAFYRAGGQDPGTTNADQFNQGYGMVSSVVKDVLATKKAMLENQKLAGESDPVGGLFGVPTAEAQASQNALITAKNKTMQPQNIYPQPSAELENGALPPNPNYAPLLTTREDWQASHGGISPDVAMGDTSEAIKLAGMGGGKPMFIGPKGEVSFDPQDMLKGYKFYENVKPQQAATLIAQNANATRPTPVMTNQQGLDATAAGNIPGKNTHFVSTNPSANLLSPEDASLQADIAFKNGGKLPNFGMGGMAARIQVAHALTQKLAAAGQGADALAVNGAAMKAGTEALGQLEKNQAVMGGFLKTLDNQLGLLSQYAGKIDNTGIPVIQRWINAGKTEVAGDSDVNSLNAIINTVNTEYNRAMNTVTGGGALADAGVQRNQQNLTSAKSPEQIMGWISAVKQESENRKSGFADQDTAIKSQLYNLGNNFKGKPNQPLPGGGPEQNPGQRKPLDSFYK